MDTQNADKRMNENDRATAPESAEKDFWLEAAREAHNQSTSFFDTNLRTKIDDNYRHFQSRHHSGSKYLKASYKYRSKHFRPKTRSAVRQNEAACVAAFFSNKDVVNIEAQSPKDPFQKASAEINMELLQYRLTKTIPWYLLCIGAFQETMVPGVCISYQSWQYEERTDTEEYELWEEDEQGNQSQIMDGKTGLPAMERKENVTVVKDEPSIELIPVENIRIHPNADWTDPLNSSPYLIHMIPYYVMDVKAKMKAQDSKTNQPKWKPLTDGQIASAKRNTWDSTRQAREGERTDKTDIDNTPDLGMFDIVWVHRVFVRVDWVDYVYYTLGTEYRLTDPIPASEVYFKDERPYAMGISVIEAHKTYPSGLTELGKPVQIEINENVNQRSDNVKFVMNKRWFVKRGAQVNLQSITRNAAGSVTLMNDPTGDVKAVDFDDVTSSAYQEQDRLNADYDELVGNFSVSSIQTNRSLNETVGGMNMLRGSSNVLTEYSLRTFSETWAEVVMRQLVKLEQKYETDEVILAIAFEKAQLYQKYGINEITDELINQELTTIVNLGMGATDPVMKLQNLSIALQTILKFAEIQQSPFDLMEIAKEVFGLLGYKDGERFFVEQMGIDPEKMQMAAMIQQMQAVIADLQKQIDMKLIDNDTKIKLAQLKEMGEDRRTAAKIKADRANKYLDLMNPVAGEKTGAMNAVR